jgi:hypothetical protein
MRMNTLAGIALILLGGFLLFGGRFTSSRNVLEIGDLKVSAQEEHPISPWIAAAALIGGCSLVVSGLRRKV